MARYLPQPEIEEAAFKVLTAGGSRDEAVQALEERFPELSGWQVSGAITVGIARLIEDFELGEVERHLEFPTDQELRAMTAQERKRRETLLEKVWQQYDSLTDEDAEPREIIAAAMKLDKLLGLGWKARLPRGSFQRGKGSG